MFSQDQRSYEIYLYYGDFEWITYFAEVYLNDDGADGPQYYTTYALEGRANEEISAKSLLDMFAAEIGLPADHLDYADPEVLKLDPSAADDPVIRLYYNRPEEEMELAYELHILSRDGEGGERYFGCITRYGKMGENLDLNELWDFVDNMTGFKALDLDGFGRVHRRLRSGIHGSRPLHSIGG